MYAGNFEKRWKVNEAKSHKMAHDTQYRSSVTTRSTQRVRKLVSRRDNGRLGRFTTETGITTRDKASVHKIGRTVTSTKAIGIKTNVTGKGRFGLRKALACESSTLVTGWII